MIVLFIILIIIIIICITNTEGFSLPLSETMSEEDIKNLRDGQKIMTNMFRQFDKICRKHKLRYWCTGGTLIGVIRHRGWIPWDGDIDLGMLETDYEIFRKKALGELTSDIWLQDARSDKHWKGVTGEDYALKKLRNLNSCYKNSQDGVRFHNGLQIDIFVFRQEGRILKPLGGWGNNQKWTDMGDVPYHYIFPLKEGDFEDLRVYIPNKYKRYAEKSWGACPPPIPKRIKRRPHEGVIDANNTCSFHFDMYPNLYKK